MRLRNGLTAGMEPRSLARTNRPAVPITGSPLWSAIIIFLRHLEVFHRLMVLEALQKWLIAGGQPARKLKEQPEVIKGLRAYNQAVQQIPLMRIRVRTITPAMVRASEAIRVQEGLMTNDSVTVALMRTLGVTDVATADADFNNVSDIRVYQPGDMVVHSK
jgi:predicted nucleic acid-binding protein